MTVIFTPNLRLLEYEQNLISDLIIDSPQSGVQITNNLIDLSGWVVGKKSPAVAVELLKQDRVILEAPIHIHRLRVAQRYAEIPGSEKSGFQVSISLPEELQERSEIVLQVILRDTTRVPIAVMSFDYRQQCYQKKTFFIHVAKTAGSSFNQFLRTHFRGDDHCEKYRKDGQITHFLDLDKLRSLDYVSGHLLLREFRRDFDRDDYFLVTLIRNPIHHVISHLNWVYYVAEDVNSDFFKSHPRHDQEIALSVRQRNLSNYREVIQALLEHKGLFMNNQSRYFKVNQALDEQNIIENLKDFDLVGITENYEQFIRDYINLQGMSIEPVVYIENKNKQPIVKKLELLSNPEFIEFMNEYNSVDMKVYDYFCKKQDTMQNQKNDIFRLEQIKAEMLEQKDSLQRIKRQIIIS